MPTMTRFGARSDRASTVIRQSWRPLSGSRVERVGTDFLSLLTKSQSNWRLCQWHSSPQGQNREQVKVCQRMELKSKEAVSGRMPANVPTSTSVETGDLSVIDAQFDAVVSSHAVEHQPDLVAHLKHVARNHQPDARSSRPLSRQMLGFEHFIPEQVARRDHRRQA